MTEEKKFVREELELGLPHMESDEPCDQPLDQSKWQAVRDYCENDVLATEAVFKKLSLNKIWRKHQ